MQHTLPPPHLGDGYNAVFLMLSLKPNGSFGTLTLSRQRLPKVTGLVAAHPGLSPSSSKEIPLWTRTSTSTSPLAALCRERSKISWVDLTSHSFPLLSSAQPPAIFKPKATGKQRFAALYSDRNRHCSYFYPPGYTMRVQVTTSSNKYIPKRVKKPL